MVAIIFSNLTALLNEFTFLELSWCCFFCYFLTTGTCITIFNLPYIFWAFFYFLKRFLFLQITNLIMFIVFYIILIFKWIFEYLVLINLLMVLINFTIQIVLLIIILINKIFLLYFIVIIWEIIFLVLFLNKLIMSYTSKFFSHFILLHNTLKLLIAFRLLTLNFFFTAFHQLLVNQLRSWEVSIFIDCFLFVFLINNFFDLITQSLISVCAYWLFPICRVYFVIRRLLINIIDIQLLQM